MTPQEAGYLCWACAEKKGGVWPEGHRATFHGAKCPICEKDAMLGCWDDWNWPKDAKANKTANRTREV